MPHPCVPTATDEPTSSSSLINAFDRVVVINLPRRPERLQRFFELLTDWPFQQPQRFEAVDGSAVPIPAGWDKGAGAYGCLLSHRRVLDCAIADGVQSLMVLEDDAHPVPGFAALAEQFLTSVPTNWDGLMFGAEHLSEPTRVQEGIVRCTASNRAHAYVVRGKLMRALSQFWENTTNDHCDVVMSALMRHFRFYAPDPLLIGQDSGTSDITGRRTRLRFLSAAHTAAIAGDDPRYRLESLIAAQRPTLRRSDKADAMLALMSECRLG